MREFSIPRLTQKHDIAINCFDNSKVIELIFTEREVESLLWRLKQADSLLKHGKLPANHA